MKRETVDRPAFMMYAANILAKREFRSMTFAERGLWITLILECWPNQEIPANENQLSEYIGFPLGDLQRTLPKVLWYFERTGEEFYCPTLEKYRDEQDARKAKQAAGGRHGAAKTNSKRSSSSKYPASSPQVPCRGSVESLDQIKTDQNKPTQSLKKELPKSTQSFIADMERAESDQASKAYGMASNGY